jgi:hypothetical protein
MYRMAIAALLTLVIGSFSSSRGAVKTLNDLTAMQIMALQESEGRLVKDDQTLQALESDLKHKRISRSDFENQSRELVSYIGEEASLQNAILTKQSTFPEHSDAVLRTIGKYAIEIPVAILCAIARSGGNFSP